MTYSIIARDPATGRLGLAVASHFFGLATHVPWLAAGVGVVATQRRADPNHGPRGLELLRGGMTATEVLTALLSDDPAPHTRQLAVLDRDGGVAAHTGSASIPAAGHHTGTGFSAQGNLLQSEGTWVRMADAFEDSAEPTLERRLLAALRAGEATGGDVRGHLAATLIVVGPDADYPPERPRQLDLRVEASPTAIDDLAHLLDLSESYRLMGDSAEGSVAEHYSEARRRAPDAMQLVFRRGIELAAAGDVDAARRELAIAYAVDSRWRTAVERFVAAGQLDRDVGRALLG